jgi:hypothetical protein
MNNDQSNDTLKGKINASLLDSPPSGFTASVMNRLPAPAPSLHYKPVITPLGWIFVGAISLLLILLGMFANGGTSRLRLPQIPVGSLPEFSLDSLFSGSALPLLLLVAVAGLFFVAADSSVRKWRTE